MDASKVLRDEHFAAGAKVALKGVQKSPSVYGD